MIKQNNKFVLGISSWTFPWAVGAATGPQPKKKMTPLELIKIAKELDVSVVQIADNMPLEQCSEHELGELKAYANENNIEIEVGTKGVDPEHLYKMLEIAQFLESKILRTLPIIFGKKIGLAEVEKNLEEVLPRFQEEGITIVLENTEAFLAKEYEGLMNKLNHPNLKMCVDTANAIGRFEGPHYVMDTLAKFCANFHFKDIKCIRSSTLMGFNMVGTISGEGQIPLEYAINKLKKNNIYTSVILEQWPPLLDNFDETLKNEKEMAQKSVANLKNYFLQY